MQNVHHIAVQHFNINLFDLDDIDRQTFVQAINARLPIVKAKSDIYCPFNRLAVAAGSVGFVIEQQGEFLLVNFSFDGSGVFVRPNNQGQKVHKVTIYDVEEVNVYD